MKSKHMGCVLAGGLAIAIGATVLVARSAEKSPTAEARPRTVDGVIVGKLYDPKKYEECVKERPGSSRCNVYLLKRVENPEYWPYPDVPPVNWPEAPKESVYRKGMTQIQYWQALCKAEAGEFIYRVVEDVEGLYMIRPRSSEPEHATYDRWVREDPYGYGQGDHTWDFFRVAVGPTTLKAERTTPFFAYLYLERPVQAHPLKPWDGKYWHPSIMQPSPGNAKYALYYGNDRTGAKSIRVRYSNTMVSRYGFTWRGISRPHDRELGVAGGEMIVVDLKTNEVLGLRRGFRLGPPDPRRELELVWSGGVCPQYAHLPGYRGRDVDFDSVLWFLTKVAVPKVAKEYIPAGR
jgi:hypothetical protein